MVIETSNKKSVNFSFLSEGECFCLTEDNDYYLKVSAFLDDYRRNGFNAVKLSNGSAIWVEWDKKVFPQKAKVIVG